MNQRDLEARVHCLSAIKQRNEVMKMLIEILKLLFDIIKFIYQIKKQKKDNGRAVNVVVIIFNFKS